LQERQVPGNVPERGKKDGKRKKMCMNKDGKSRRMRDIWKRHTRSSPGPGWKGKGRDKEKKERMRARYRVQKSTEMDALGDHKRVAVCRRKRRRRQLKERLANNKRKKG